MNTNFEYVSTLFTAESKLAAAYRATYEAIGEIVKAVIEEELSAYNARLDLDCTYCDSKGGWGVIAYSAIETMYAVEYNRNFCETVETTDKVLYSALYNTLKDLVSDDVMVLHEFYADRIVFEVDSCIFPTIVYTLHNVNK